MTVLQTSFMGLLDFLFKFIVASFLLRLLAIKLSSTNAGAGLGALVM
jgi:hypothetical protein